MLFSNGLLCFVFCHREMDRSPLEPENSSASRAMKRWLGLPTSQRPVGIPPSSQGETSGEMLRQKNMAAPRTVDDRSQSQMFAGQPSSSEGDAQGMLQTLGPLLQLQSNMFMQAMKQGLDSHNQVENLTPVKRGTSSIPDHNLSEDSEEEGEIAESIHTSVNIAPTKSGDPFAGLDTLMDDNDQEGNESSGEDDAGMLGELAAFFKADEKKGPKIEATLADVIVQGLKSTPNHDKLKQLVETYPTPDNLPISVPKVNPELWAKMGTTSRSQDLKLQNIQLGVVKALVGTTQTLNSLLKGEKMSTKEMKLKLSHIVQLLSNTHLCVSTRRKELIKPDLGQAYQRLCGHNSFPSDLLFGDDLATRIKEMDDTVKFTQKMGASCQHSQRSHPYKSYSPKRGGKWGPKHANKSTKNYTQPYSPKQQRVGQQQRQGHGGQYNTNNSQRGRGTGYKNHNKN